MDPKLQIEKTNKGEREEKDKTCLTDLVVIDRPEAWNPFPLSNCLVIPHC
jgi:hypothetical protein